MAEPYGCVVRTDGANEFRDAIATNAADFLEITQADHDLPVDVFDIVRLSVLSVQNLAWDVYIYDSPPGAPTEHDNNPVVDWVSGDLHRPHRRHGRGQSRRGLDAQQALALLVTRREVHHL